MKIFKRVLICLAILLVISMVGFIIWGLNPYAPMPEAMRALKSDSTVTVKTGDWLEFTPTNQTTMPVQTGYIFYPGGHVDYRAYAPLARAIAAKGYLVVIPSMPLSLPVLAPNRATDIIAQHPEISHWAIGGHSLGGSMAANFAKNNLAQIEGLNLNASYPAKRDDLAQSSLKVLSVYASLDGLVSISKIDASRPLLPTDTTWVLIEGGNHAQFGYYGPQSGDNPATIDRSLQQEQIISASLDLLSTIK